MADNRLGDGVVKGFKYFWTLFFLCFLFFWGSAGSLCGNPVDVKSEADKLSCNLNDLVVYTITITGVKNPEMPRLTDLKDFIIIKSIQRNCGSSADEPSEFCKKFSFHLLPQKEGLLTIPVFEYRSNNAIYRAKAIQINVSKNINKNPKKSVVKKKVEAVRKEKYYISKGKSLDWYMTKGDDFYKRKKYVSAKMYYKQVLKLDAEDPKAMDRLKKCDLMLNQSEGEKKFNDYIKRGDNSLAKKEVKYALSYYLKAYQIFPKNESQVVSRFKKIAKGYTAIWDIFKKDNQNNLKDVLNNHFSEKKENRQGIQKPVETGDYVSDVDKAPVEVETSVPIFSKKLRKKIKGDFVSFTTILLVDENGNVCRIKMKKYTYIPEIDMKLARFICKWKFKPAMKDGKRVKTWYKKTINIYK